MNSHHRYVRTALAAAAAFFCFAGAASDTLAGTPVDPSTRRTENLTLADLDLSRAEGVQIARERIRLLAQHLCQQVREPLSLSQHQAFVDCLAHATAAAEPKLAQLASAQASAAKFASLQR